MAAAVIRPEEGFGTEGTIQTQGIGLTEGTGQMEGAGIMEGTGKTAAPRASAPAAPKSAARSARPAMRSAVVWAEILGKPKALKGRR